MFFALNKRVKNIIFSIISGIILGYSVINLNSYLVWVAFVPFFIAIKNQNMKFTIYNTIILTSIIGLFGLFWIPFSFEKYTGAFSLLSILAAIVLTISVIIFFLFWIVCLKKIEILSNSSKTKTIILNAMLVSILFFLVEFISYHTFQGIPWNKYSLRCSLSSNLYFLQLTPIIGSLGLSVIVISVNYLLAEFFLSKNKTILILAISIFFINLLYGFLIVEFKNENDKDKKYVALVCENVKAETKWTQEGDAIISRMLKLVREVKPFKPELIVWSESALPWTYIENDDILLAIAEILKGNITQNIIGYLTQSEKDSNLVYNSAYLIDKKGSSLGRYDKSILLDFIEKPFLSDDYSNILPMLTSSRYDNVLPGKGNRFLHTNIGKCKIEICNESLIPNYFDNDDTFEFIVNISNDAWLEETHNIQHHFYFARLKAIEYRKYLIINSNRGISGIVDGNGLVQVLNESDVSEKITGYIIPNNYRTLYSQFPLMMPIISIFTLIIIIIYRFKNNSSREDL